MTEQPAQPSPGAVRIGKTSNKELDEIADESYRQIQSHGSNKAAQPSQYRCDEDDINCLNDYFMAALNGEEPKEKLLKLWQQELGVVRHSLLSQQQEPAPFDEMRPWAIGEVLEEISRRLLASARADGEISIEDLESELRKFSKAIVKLHQGMSDKHDAVIRAAGVKECREQTLKEIYDHFVNLYMDINREGDFTPKDAYKYIKTLRQQQPKKSDIS